MTISRRRFLRGSAGIATALAAQHAFGKSRLQPWLLAAQQVGSSGIPKIVVEDFLKEFDPAYLSNGLIGFRPGPNPLAGAPTYVGGFVTKDDEYRMECLALAPYPLCTDIRVSGISLLESPQSIETTKQTLDMATGELITEMVFAPGTGVTLNLSILQFASRSVPSLLCQEILVTSPVDIDITLTSAIETRYFPGTIYMNRTPGSTRADLAGGFATPAGTSKLVAAAWIVMPEDSVQRLPRSTTGVGITRTLVTKLTAGRPLHFQTIAAMVSDIYDPEPELEAIRLASWGATLCFDELRNKNREAWSELWQSRVKITGDTDDQRVLDAAFFYLHASLHPSTRTGMPPYGLSQSRFYSGHSFWDTESWSFLPILLSAPGTARALLDFRLRSLDMAKRQAALYGYRGAQFPWEAAQTGALKQLRPAVTRDGSNSTRRPTLPWHSGNTSWRPMIRNSCD